jgi:hypothetical protein
LSVESPSWAICELLPFKGKLYVFDNVPVGLCRKCGERYYRGSVLEWLEDLAGHKDVFKKKIQVPRFDFAAAAIF